MIILCLLSNLDSHHKIFTFICVIYVSSVNEKCMLERELYCVIEV